MKKEKPLPHPAKFNSLVLAAIGPLLPPTSLTKPALILDPFAGVGRIHAFYPRYMTFGIELEPEWAEQHWRNEVGNALDLPWYDDTFDAICTSPCYGNRMADHHEAKDDSYRATYRHYLGRPLHPDNSGQMQWGEQYRDFHRRAWVESIRVLKPGGRFILNISDHYRAGKLVRVSRWHRETLVELGLQVVSATYVRTPRLRRGANHALRIPYESVVLFTKGQ